MKTTRNRLAVFGIASAILMTSLSAQGAGPTGLMITDDGYYSVTVDANGKPGNPVKITSVMDLRTNPNNPPPTDPVPPPDSSDPIAAKVSEWAKAVNDPTSAQALAVAYREVGKVSAGQPRDKVMTALRMASDSVLSSTNGTEKWKPWRSNVSGLIDAEEAKGPIDWPKFCGSVAKGLEASSPSRALTPELLETIIRLVLEIIKTIFNLTGGGGGV